MLHVDNVTPLFSTQAFDSNCILSQSQRAPFISLGIYSNTALCRPHVNPFRRKCFSKSLLNELMLRKYLHYLVTTTNVQCSSDQKKNRLREIKEYLSVADSTKKGLSLFGMMVWA